MKVGFNKYLKLFLSTNEAEDLLDWLESKRNVPDIVDEIRDNLRLMLGVVK